MDAEARRGSPRYAEDCGRGWRGENDAEIAANCGYLFTYGRSVTNHVGGALGYCVSREQAMNDKEKQRGRILNYAAPGKTERSDDLAFWVLLALTVWLFGVTASTPGDGHQPHILTFLTVAPGAVIPWVFVYRGERRAWAMLLLLLNLPMFVATIWNFINRL
jgi:hypothetical protein